MAEKSTKKNEVAYQEVQIDDPEVINIVINPNDLQNSNGLGGNTPLFVKKLWKIVNDENNKDIVSWNENGDGFILHDQLQFISKTLPRYFKHNQLSSFVRQLNLYGFHKIQNVDRDEFHFSHPFFLKDIPQLLPLIKRKTPTGRQKNTTNESTEIPPESSEVTEVISAINEVKNKHEAITDEMAKLKQENAAVWGELNSLRVKYSKQTKIINKLIHFLIAYMQKHHSTRKPGRTVSANNSNKYLKTGPKIMELDYRYKNNPHEFWTEFDNQLDVPDQNEQQAYTVVEPAEINNETESDNQSPSTVNSPNMRVSSTIEEILPGAKAFNQLGGSPVSQPQYNYSVSSPSSSKGTNSALQRTGASQENMGYLIDNSRVEMNTIKELIKNLTPEDLTSFYKMVNENYKIQDDDVTISTENDLNSLAQLIPSTQDSDIHIEEALEPLNNIIGKQEVPETAISIAALDDIIQQQDNNVILERNLSPPTIEPLTSNEKIDENNLDIIINDDLLNSDDLLNDVSVSQYFNID